MVILSVSGKFFTDFVDISGADCQYDVALLSHAADIVFNLLKCGTEDGARYLLSQIPRGNADSIDFPRGVYFSQENKVGAGQLCHKVFKQRASAL